MRVGVDRLDVPRATLVGDLRDCPDKRQVLGVGRDAEQLPGLEVDPYLDGEACVAGEALVRSHATQPTTARYSFIRNSASASW